MKKILSYSVVLTLLAGLMGLSSCTKAPLVLKYNLGDIAVSIPANPNYTYQTFTFPIRHSDIQTFLTNNGGSADLSKISSAIVDGISAQVVTTGSDFSQIKSIEVYLAPATNTTTAGDQVAYSESLAGGVTNSVLKVNGSDEKQLLSGDMVLTVKILPVTTGNAAIDMKLTQGVIAIKVNQ